MGKWNQRRPLGQHFKQEIIIRYKRLLIFLAKEDEMNKRPKASGLLLLLGAIIILAIPLSAVHSKAETGYFWGTCTLSNLVDKKIMVTNVFTADWDESTTGIENQLYDYLVAEYPNYKINRMAVGVMGPYKEGDAYEKRNEWIARYRNWGYEVIEVSFAYHSN
jgi:hypothetical protein